MKIVFLTPGDIPVPPDGWGALETVVWNQYLELKKLNYDVHIVNEINPEVAFNKIIEINPDVIHLHYGKHYELMPRFKCRKIITNHDGSFLMSRQFHESLIRGYLYDCEFFCLTTWERDFLFNLGISLQKIKLLPNGVSVESFSFKEKPSLKNSTICVGKIDNRKNQAFLQSLDLGIYFVGQNTIPDFNCLDKKYLGHWNRNQLCENLTNYTNLILMSDLELHPLVCLEALSAGLGLVVSSVASQNLDLTMPFITVVDQSLIKDPQTVHSAISNNIEVCNNFDRKNIREYSKNFSWSNLINKYINHLKQ